MLATSAQATILLHATYCIRTATENKDIVQSDADKRRVEDESKSDQWAECFLLSCSAVFTIFTFPFSLMAMFKVHSTAPASHVFLTYDGHHVSLYAHVVTYVVCARI
jgi:hypothetical protein